jgi:outer membrane lipoprotein-sorting protein
MGRTAAFILLLASLACAQSTQPADPRLEAIDKTAAAIADLTATFEQEKHSPLLKKPLVSKGTVLAKGSAMLWTTDSPRKTVMRVDAKSLQILYVDDKVLEVYPVDGKLGQLAASPLPRLALLKEQFTIEKIDEADDALTLTLKPADDKLKEHVDQVVVTIDKTAAVIRSFELTDPDGERTVIRFSGHRVNTGIEDASLELKPPAGTKIVHPLGMPQ